MAELTQSKSAIEVLAEIQATEEEAKEHGNLSPDDPAAGAWARVEIGKLRASALGTASIYGYCFVKPYNFSFEFAYGILMLVISLVIQTLVPLGILATRQPILNIDEEIWGSKGCPMRADGLTKFVGLLLSLYFVTLSISLCTNKLRGLGFLKTFVSLGSIRGAFIDLAILSQFVSMTAVGGAQFLLFIGNAGNDRGTVVLLLQSLAMQFCLTVDQKLVSDQIGRWTNKRLAAVSADHLLCNGCGVGEGEGGIPKEAYGKLQGLIKSERVVLGLITLLGILWSIAVAVCM